MKTRKQVTTGALGLMVALGTAVLGFSSLSHAVDGEIIVVVGEAPCDGIDPDHLNMAALEHGICMCAAGWYGEDCNDWAPGAIDAGDPFGDDPYPGGGGGGAQCTKSSAECEVKSPLAKAPWEGCVQTGNDACDELALGEHCFGQIDNDEWSMRNRDVRRHCLGAPGRHYVKWFYDDDSNHTMLECRNREGADGYRCLNMGTVQCEINWYCQYYTNLGFEPIDLCQAGGACEYLEDEVLATDPFFGIDHYSGDDILATDPDFP